MTALIFGPANDSHSLAVAREIRLLGHEVIHLDTETIPADNPLALTIGERRQADVVLEIGEHRLSASDVSGV